MHTFKQRPQTIQKSRPLPPAFSGLLIFNPRRPEIGSSACRFFSSLRRTFSRPQQAVSNQRLLFSGQSNYFAALRFQGDADLGMWIFTDVMLCTDKEKGTNKASMVQRPLFMHKRRTAVKDTSVRSHCASSQDVRTVVGAAGRANGRENETYSRLSPSPSPSPIP